MAARNRNPAFRIAMLVLVLVLASAAGAQMLPGAHIAPPPTAQTPKKPAPPQVPRITANVSLVNLVFSVEDARGAFISGLAQKDFRVFEDGKEQVIEFFSADSQLPLTLGLLLDTSPSQSNVLAEEQRISDQFFQQVMQPKDLAFVIGFDVQVRLLQDLTAQLPHLDAAINGAHIGGGDAQSYGGNPGPFPNSGGGGATHLWDAIYLACHDEIAQQVGRKALIVVTDGGEQGSSYTHADALRAALDANTAVFVVMTVDRSYGGFGGYNRGAGPGQLRQIAEQTGGRVINAGRHLGEAFQRLAAELRSQYSLGYRSNLPGPGGQFRSVRIELQPAAAKAHPGARIRARSGYFAPGAPPAG